MTDATTFSDFDLPYALQSAVEQVGYETPSPIQAQCIPLLLDGHDVLGQAQTGTGKTAAFALPLLARVNNKDRSPQILILVPTRELALQVSEAVQRYAQNLKGFHVLPIYGGTGFDQQLRALKKGVQVVVGTPGRVMDHMRRKTLKLGGLNALVLDEADEMLRMGFIDDVEWILENVNPERQMALFSATMPKQIKKVADQHLTEPKLVQIKSETTTAETVRQRYWSVAGLHKLDALTRILEVEDLDAAIIFVRTRNSTLELAEKLQARGFDAAPLNGEITQAQREKTVEQLKSGKIDIIVATDVAARGLDVKRISHVFNYDIPYDTESYVHRIGRTGRAGRSGDAILFVAPRERRMLYAIERATGQKIECMDLPTAKEINVFRLAKFKQRISDAMASEEIDPLFLNLVQELEKELDVEPVRLAAVLASLVQGDVPLLLNEQSDRKLKRAGKEQSERSREDRRKPRTDKRREDDSIPMEQYMIAVGREHGVKPGNIVGAIANEAGLESKYIGHIRINDDHSLVDLPEGMPKEVYEDLQSTVICGRKIQLRLWQDRSPSKKSFRAEGKLSPSGRKKKAGKQGKKSTRKSRPT